MGMKCDSCYEPATEATPITVWDTPGRGMWARCERCATVLRLVRDADFVVAEKVVTVTA